MALPPGTRHRQMDQTGKVWGGREVGVRVDGGGGRRERGGGQREGGGDAAALLRVRCPSPACIPAAPALVRGEQADPQLKPGTFQGATSTFSSKMST